MRKRFPVLASAAAAVVATSVPAFAIVQTYSGISGTGALQATHPGDGFFQNDGEFDDGITGDFGFGGTANGFMQDTHGLLDGGLSGLPGDHGAEAIFDYTGTSPTMPQEQFWFDGLGNDAGPLPSLTLSNVLVFADVYATGNAGKPFTVRLESDFTTQGNGFQFSANATGQWQTVGGPMSTMQPFGSFNPADPNLAILAAFADELTWDSGPEPAAILHVDNFTFTIASAAWSGTTAGSWSDNAHWTGNFAPDGANAVAIFGSNASGHRHFRDG